jgi:hypothetical protein
MKLYSGSSCNSNEEFNLGFAGHKMKLQSESSCFSREEFNLGFAQVKGDIK